MKKLGDETHEYGAADHRRTIWYQFDEKDEAVKYIFSKPLEGYGNIISSCDYTVLAEMLKRLIEIDLQAKPETIPSEIHWIFYTHNIDGDAIGDKVRFSICIRLKGGLYDCNINMSDFIFASSLDNVLAIKKCVEDCLNYNNS